MTISTGPKREHKSARPGIALLLVVLITSALLAVSVGIFTTVFGQLRISEEVAYSFTALYAADEGIERLLYEDLVTDSVPGCSGVSPCSYESADINLPNGACMKLRLTRAPSRLTTLTAVGEYRCIAGTLAVKRALRVSYQKPPP
jgi:hypothetical protein